MSDDIAPSALLQVQQQPSKDEIISLARKAIEASRDIERRTADGTLAPEQPPQQTAVSVDLTNKQIVKLPDEVIEIIKDEIERLAISHNKISTFPPRLAECEKLRYLNGRYNSLKEIPRAVLQLPALAVLDLSRNRIRTIPEDIRHMRSLKVLALQRNRIERLPLCIGDMSGLIVLKVGENPLVFPPREVCGPDDEHAGVTGTGDQAMTQRIKKYLRDYASQSVSVGIYPKGRPHIDSDGELSEGNAETPRPFRPVGTRFPVRPSISGLDAMVNPTPRLSASPEPPPIPMRSHERIRSNQISQPRKQPLLSPPDSSMILLGPMPFSETGNDVTVRPKRHGIITPRGPEGAAQQMALSPSALQEAFSNIGSRPASRTGSAKSTSSFSAKNMVDISKTVFHATGDLCRRLGSLRNLKELQNQPMLKAQIETELRSAFARSDSLQKSVSRTPGEAELAMPSRNIIKPLIECSISISHLCRLLSHTSGMYCRSNSHDSYRQTFWNAQRDIWELHVANMRMSDALTSVNHSRQTSASSQSQYVQPYVADIPRLGPPGTLDGRVITTRNGTTISPTSSTYSGTTLQTATAFSSMSNSISPLPMINTNTGRAFMAVGPNVNFVVREEDSRQEAANDGTWDEVCRLLHAVCDSASENLSKVQSHYRGERQRALRQFDSDHDIVKQLGSLLNRCNGLIEASNALARRLDALTPNDRSVRHSLEFWTYPRTVFLEWYAFAERIKLLPAAYNSEVKSMMRPIHQLIKAASSLVQNSPWGMHLSKSNYSSVSSGPPSSGGFPALSVHAQSSNIGSVPSTPLSAALGPAAASAVGSKSGLGRPAINFFERADRYVSSNVQRQDLLYGKR